MKIKARETRFWKFFVFFSNCHSQAINYKINWIIKKLPVVPWVSVIRFVYFFRLNSIDLKIDSPLSFNAIFSSSISLASSIRRSARVCVTCSAVETNVFWEVVFSAKMCDSCFWGEANSQFKIQFSIRHIKIFYWQIYHHMNKSSQYLKVKYIGTFKQNHIGIWKEKISRRSFQMKKFVIFVCDKIAKKLIQFCIYERMNCGENYTWFLWTSLSHRSHSDHVVQQAYWLGSG